MNARRLAIPAVLCLGLMSAACASPSKPPSAGASDEGRPDVSTLLTQGQHLAASGDYLRAEQYLGAALSAGAGDRAVLPALLHACVEARHYRLASEYAQAALDRDPTNARLRFMTAALYLAIGERGRAREQFEMAASQLSSDANVQFAVAVFFRDEMSDRVSADPYFQRYLQVSPAGAHASEARASLMERIQ